MVKNVNRMNQMSEANQRPLAVFLEAALFGGDQAIVLRSF